MPIVRCFFGMWLVCAFKAFTCIHALHTSYASVAHGLRCTYVLHRASCIAFYQQLQGEHCNGRPKNDYGENQRLDHDSLVRARKDTLFH